MLQTISRAAVEKSGILTTIDKDPHDEVVSWNKNGKLRSDDSISMEHLLSAPQKAGTYVELKLCVPTFRGFAVLKLEDIILCEAEKNYTIFHLKEKKPIIVSRSLLEYEKILERTSFIRIHRSFLINLSHVLEYRRGEGGTAIMSNGAEVEISRRKKELFLVRIKKEFWK